jgi:hypothetical protein
MSSKKKQNKRIRESMKNFLAYFFPLILLDLIRCFRGILLNLPNFLKIKKNNHVKDSKFGKKVFVIANGPSLNNFDKSLLFGKEVIVMNNFHLCEWKHKVSIVAHCIGEPKTSSHWGKDQIEIMLGTDSDSYWYHFSNAKEVEESEISLNNNCYFAAPLIPPGLWRSDKKVDLSSSVLGYESTSQLAIMVALHLGYKDICLIGFDHDWLANRNISPHFYKEREGVKKADLSFRSYYEIINISKSLWEIYIKIKSSSIKSGAKITNLSNPTYLDVFDDI